MAEFISIKEGGFEQCLPPFCSKDITVIITQFECIGETVYVTWEINDEYERNLIPTTNKVFYSLNSLATNNDNFETPYTSSSPYQSYFQKPEGEGVIYIRVETEINGEFFFAVPDTFIHSYSCDKESLLAVRSSVCSEYIEEFGSIDYSIWIKKNVSHQVFPLYFQYDGVCLFISEDNWNNPTLISNINLDVGDKVLDSLDSDGVTIYSSCQSCILEEACLTQWIEDPKYPGDSEKDKADIYLEYTTFGVRDEVIVYGPDPNKNCSGDVLWTSTCVGTCRGYKNNDDDCSEPDRICEDGGEGPGIYLRKESLFMNYNNSECTGFRFSDDGKDVCTKQTCFTMRREQLPISIRVSSQCDGDTDLTWWCAYAKGPDFTYCKCEGIDDCSEAIESPPINFSCAPFTLETVVDVSPKTSTPYTVLEAESGTLFTNEGATGVVQFDLPSAPANGTWYMFHIYENEVVQIDPFGTDRIEDNSGPANGKYIWADAKGEAITLVYNGANRWMVLSKYGVWGAEA